MVLKKTVTVLGAAVMIWVLLSWAEVIFTASGGELWIGNAFSLIANNF